MADFTVYRDKGMSDPILPYTLDQVSQLPDPLLSYQYRLDFSEIPINLKLIPMGTLSKLFAALNPFDTMGDAFGREADRQINAINTFSPKVSLMESGMTLSIRARTCTFPGSSIDPCVVDLAGYTLSYAGQAKINNSFTVDFYEDQNLTVYRLMCLWMAACKNFYGQIGHMKGRPGNINPNQGGGLQLMPGVEKGYAGKVHLYIYNSRMEPTAHYYMDGVWPKDMPDISFDNTSATMITTSVSFSCDICDEQM